VNLDVRVEWIQPDIGLIDVFVDAKLPDAARAELRRGDVTVSWAPLEARRRGDVAAARLYVPDPEAGAPIALAVIAPGLPETVVPLARPDASRFPPAWTLGAVWYQIFPDRFRNANPANDPAGLDVYTPAWSAPWEHVSIDEFEQARARSNRRAADGSPLDLVATRRRYGGDLQGVVEQLDYLTDLGATAIYLNPIFDAPSAHKYDARDHRHVDPTLGAPDAGSPPPGGETADPGTWTWTPADRYLLDTLLPAAHARGLRVVLDGVWNHVGRDHWAFQDVLARGASSEYADWFRMRFAGDDDQSGRTSGEVDSWDGWDRPNGHLPAFAQTSDGDLVPPVSDHIEAITRRWMTPDAAHAIDGWRLDVALDIGLAYWRRWCALVNDLNPEAVTIGEIWFKGDDYLAGDAFDAQMNYPMRGVVLRWLKTEEAFDADVLVDRLEAALEHPDRVNLAQMNLVGSHDTPRLVTFIANRHADGTGDDRPTHADHELANLAIAMMVALPGAPCVYYADEWGTRGANDPHNRKPMPWPDLGPFDNDSAPLPWVHEAWRSWLRLRTAPTFGPALRLGDWRLQAIGADAILIERRLNEQRVVVLANRSDGPLDVSRHLSGLRPLPKWPGGDGVVGARSAAIWASE
jgi:glycosidase